MSDQTPVARVSAIFDTMADPDTEIIDAYASVVTKDFLRSLAGLGLAIGLAADLALAAAVRRLVRDGPEKFELKHVGHDGEWWYVSLYDDVGIADGAEGADLTAAIEEALRDD